jgi:hypothetical protein
VIHPNDDGGGAPEVDLLDVPAMQEGHRLAQRSHD